MTYVAFVVPMALSFAARSGMNGACGISAGAFVGFDEAAKNYICHWVDVFGGHYSDLGRGKIDPNLISLEFRFVPKNGELTNKFMFDPQTKTWTSLIRQQEKGEWKTFAEEKWTRVEDKK